jgi:hypothetical protein
LTTQYNLRCAWCSAGVAQSRSTINLRDAITRGKIVLIHTALDEVGTEIALDPHARPRVTARGN